MSSTASNTILKRQETAPLSKCSLFPKYREEKTEKTVDIYDKETIGRVLDSASNGFMDEGSRYEITFHPEKDRTGECFYLYYE